MRIARPLIVVALLAASATAGVQYPLPSPLPDGMKHVEGQYHLLVTDLSDAEAAEVMARMEAMVREYLFRTRDFSGRIQGKMPFVLFRNESDYHNAGGPDETGGVFTGQALMAFSDKRLSSATWHVIQHEGFHQFAANVIGGELPIWVNEGMAEYFGEAVYCGDGFVSGGIPAYRLRRVKEEIKNKSFHPIAEMMAMSHEEWNKHFTEENYDQAWAMVQFLAHADDGKYRKAFTQFMVALSHRRPAAMAWDESFGSAEGFEKRWQAWWDQQPVNATVDVYAQAATRMLAAYTARAVAMKQTFADVDAIVAAIKDGTIQAFPADALPPGLAADCVSLAGAVKTMGATFAIERPTHGTATTPVAITCTLADGRVIRATTPTHGVHPTPGQWTVTPPKKATTQSAVRKPD